MTRTASVHRPCQPAVAFLAAAALLSPGPAWAAPASPFPALGPGLSLLERSYLFEPELQPPRLFDEAAKVFARDVGDLTVRREGDLAWVLATPDCELRVELAGDATVRSMEAPLASVGRLLEACSSKLPPEMPEMDSYLLAGVLAGLDPYSTVFDEKKQVEHNIQYQGKLAGIGARIGSRRNQLTLIEVYPDSPAARADLRDDDEVLRIDDLSTKNILATDAVERIRGEEGTTVTLLIRRKGEVEPRSVVVTRGIVVIPSVKSRMISSDILVAEITQFSQATPDDFRQHLERALDDTRLRGVIIDLRRNSGGSMMGSSAIGDLFLREGLLISTAGRDGQPARGLTSEVRASGRAIAPDLPVIFLTSPVTASGSELLAASLRNNDRALLVGEHTFGKGCIQKTFPLHDTSTIKMSVGHFLPNGRPIPGGGLIPDVEVLRYRVGDGRLAVPLPSHRSDMPFWLRTPRWSSEKAAPASYRIAFAEDYPEDDPSLIEDPEEAMIEAEKREKEKPDRTVEIAAAILRNHGNASATRMLEDAAAFLEQSVDASEADLVDFMVDHRLDWTAGPHPQAEPHLSLEVRPLEPLRAGEESEVDVRLTNHTAATYYRVRGVLQSTATALDGRPVAFGRIEPGGTRSWRMRLKTPHGTRTGRVRAEALLFDDDGEIGKTLPVRLAIAEDARPHLAVRTRVAADPADPGRVDVTVDVENRGQGPALKVMVRMKHPKQEHFEILEGTGDSDSLAPGASTSFVLKARLGGSFEKLPEATVSVAEQKHGLLLERTLPLVPDAARAVDWNEAPRIAIDGLREVEDGRWELAVTASDDHALALVRARIDDRTELYLEPSGEDRRRAVFALPWNPADDVKKLRIEAEDDTGLKELYAGTL